MSNEQLKPADEGPRSSEVLGRFWSVEVDCWYRDKPRSKVHKRVRRTIVLEAATSDEAFRMGADHAAKTAPMGPKWVGFEVLRASTVRLPMTVNSWHHGTRPAA